MKKFILLLIVAFVGLVDMQAQMYNIYVRNAEGKPLKGVMVYTFPIKNKGLEAYREAVSNYGRFDLVRNGVVARGETQTDGLCVIEGRKSGAIILDGYGVSGDIYGISLYYVEDYVKGSLDNTIELVLKSEGLIVTP